MQQEDKDRLEEDFMYLCASMKELKRLVKFLKDRETITESQAEDVMDEASDYLKASRLLKYLLRNGDEAAFNDFYDGCLNTHLWTCADIIKPEEGPHEPDEEEIEDFLPDVWPVESHVDVIKNPQKATLDIVGPKNKKMMALYNEDLTKSTAESTVYSLKLEKKGKMMIINNMYFKDWRFPIRLGSDYDVCGLNQLFSSLGYEIHHTVDRTTKQMEEDLVSEFEKIRSSEVYSSFILIILSYGYNHKFLFGTDGELEDDGQPKEGTYIEIGTIKACFSNIPQLVNKPKVFIFDAQPVPYDSYCGAPSVHGMANHAFMREQDSVKGIHRHHMSAASKRMEVLAPFITYKKDRRYSFKEMSSKLMLEEPEYDFSDGVENAPTQSDVFQALVILSDKVMFRGTSYGSWFVQGFIHITYKNAFQCDIQTLFEKVNNLFKDQSVGKQNCQICETTSTMNKKLYFFPGLPIQN